MHPAVGENVGVGQLQPCRELRSEVTQDVECDGRGIGDHQHEIAGLGARDGHDRPDALLAQEFGNRRTRRAARIDRDVSQAFRPEPACLIDELVDPGPRGVGHSGSDDSHDATAGSKRVVEHPEA